MVTPMSNAHTETAEVLATEVKVGDYLARISPNGGYCAPIMSFRVIEVTEKGYRYEHPETGEVLESGPLFPGTTTRKVIGWNIGS